jgi:hypothetical protein
MWGLFQGWRVGVYVVEIGEGGGEREREREREREAGW